MNLHEALRLIVVKSPAATREAVKGLRLAATDANLQLRYNMVAQWALSDPQAEFSADERASLVDLMTANGEGETRSSSVNVRLSDAERADLEQRAEAAGYRGRGALSEYVRAVLFSA